MGFELRASCLLGWCSTSCATPPAPKFREGIYMDLVKRTQHSCSIISSTHFVAYRSTFAV
jgi:hypothetical protein